MQRQSVCGAGVFSLPLLQISLDGVPRSVHLDHVVAISLLKLPRFVYGGREYGSDNTS